MDDKFNSIAESASIAKGINDYLNHYVSVADAKAGALAVMAALSGSVSSYFIGDDPDNVLQWIMKCSLFFHFLTLMTCCLIVFPRKPSRGDSVIFWEDIAQDNECHVYQDRFELAVSNNFSSREYSSQNYYISKVLSTKHFWLRMGIILYAVAAAITMFMLNWPVAIK